MPTHQENLKAVNDVVLPKFHCKEQLKSRLENEADPIVKDEIQHKMLELRNDIIVDVIEGLKGMLAARASNWRVSLCDDTLSYSHIPKWYIKIKPDAIMSYIHVNLLEAVERYNPYKKPFCKFTSFFWTHNDNMLKNQYKKLYVDKSDISKVYSFDVIDANKGQDEEGERFSKPYQDSRKCRGHRKLHPNLMISEEVAENQLHHNLILKKLLKKTVSMKERHIIKWLYLGYSQSEIAEKLRCSKTNVSMAIKNLAFRSEDLVCDMV